MKSNKKMMTVLERARFGAIALCLVLLASCGGGGGAPTIGGTPGADAGTSSGSTTGTPVALFSTAPASLVLPVSASSTDYKIGGGTAPYIATSSNTGMLTVSVVGGTMKITGVSVGTAQIVVHDALGAALNIAVTIGSNTPLRTTAPVALTSTVGATGTYTISGGLPPYVATSSNVSVVGVGTNGSTLTISSLLGGSGQIVVMDAVGGIVTIAVTVGSTSVVANNLYTTAPDSITITLGGAATSYVIGGGTGPYTATSSNVSVATASISGSVLSVTGVSAGQAQVVVRDSSSQVVPITVTVLATVTASTPPPSVSPTSLTAGPCTTNIPFLITGGSPPFSIISSDNVSVTVSTAMPLGAGYIFTASIGSLQSYFATGSVSPNFTLTVLDSKSQATSAKIAATTVSNAACPVSVLLQTTPSTAITHVTQSQSFQIAGGTAPYTVTTGSAAIATVSAVSGSTFSASGVLAGSTLLTVTSADGQKANITFTVIP